VVRRCCGPARQPGRLVIKLKTEHFTFIQVRKMAAMSEAEFKMQKGRLLDKANMAKNRPFGYYEILELSHKAKATDIKKAYFQKAKIYHPDAFPMTDTDGIYRAEIARIKFDEITEAYQTLMDIDQRCFYDKHGYPSDALKQKELPDIFNYVPKFSIYEEEILADNETTELEDWMATQGHSARDQNISFKQRLKNAYIEYKWGMAYWNFPWNPKLMAAYCASLIAIFFTGRYLLTAYYKNFFDRLAMSSDMKDRYRLPVQKNDWFKNDDPRDLLSYIGIRKKYVSDASRGGLYHLDTPAAPKRERDPNKAFSEEFFTTMKEISSYSANKDRHANFKFSKKLRRLEFLLKQRSYLENQLELASEALVIKAKAAEKAKSDPKLAVPNWAALASANEFLDMKSDKIKFKISEMTKQLASVDKDLDSIATGSDSDEKLAVPAKFS